MNTAAGWQIEVADSRLTEGLARLHAAALPDDFLPSLGRGFLGSVYYPAAMASPYGITLAATAAGDPVGFVTVAHDAHRFIGDVIRKNLTSISYYVTRRTLRRPRTVIDAFGLAWQTLTARPDQVCGEIVFIAVDASRRGSGLGTALVRSALDYLATRHVSHCRTKTLAGNNRVIGMYARLGWTVRGQFRLIGREYVTIVSPVIDFKGSLHRAPGSREE